MGSTDRNDGTFVWPEGLLHYVERHDVRLPAAFVAHVERQGSTPISRALPKITFGLYDRGPWLAFGAAAGACLDLGGFAVPDGSMRERIADDLGADAPDELDAIVLCDGRSREVVVSQPDGTLCIHSVRSGACSVRQLAGWHAWPRLGAGSSGRSAAIGKLPALAKPRPGLTLDAFVAKHRQDRGRPPRADG
jgi:hypothetical protein